MAKMTPLLLTLALVACQSTLPHVSGPKPSGAQTAVTVTTSPARPRPVLVIPGPERLESASGQLLTSGPQEALVMKVRIQRPSFRTQAFDLQRIRFLKGLVRAIDLDNPRENKEGFVAVDVNEKSLRIEGIPKGKNRIVTVQAYEGTVGNEVLIPDIVLKAIYSSVPDSDEVAVNFSLQSTLAANVLEALIDQPLGPNETPADREALISGLPIADPATPNAPGTLEALINSISQGSQTPASGDNPFGGTPVPPSTLDPEKIADAVLAAITSNPETPIPVIPSDNTALTPWLKPTGTVALVAQNPAETPYTHHQIVVQISDPGSPPIIISPQSSPADPGAPANPNGPIAQNDIDLSFSQIPEGTWDVIATVVDENGQVRSEQRLQVTVDATGNVTFTDPAGTDPEAPITDPTLTFPPFLDAVTNSQGNSVPSYPGGSTVVLDGDGFDVDNPAANIVTVGGVTAQIGVVTATSIEVILPPSVGGEDVPIVVTTNGKASNSQSVNITPVVVDLDRDVLFADLPAGAPERVITISVAGFNPTEYPDLKLEFTDANGNTLSVAPTSTTPTSITVVVPTDAVSGPIEVVRTPNETPIPSPVLTLLSNTPPTGLYADLVNFIGPNQSPFAITGLEPSGGLPGFDPAATSPWYFQFNTSNPGTLYYQTPTNPVQINTTISAGGGSLAGLDPHGITVDGCNAMYVVGTRLLKFNLAGEQQWNVALQTVSEDASVLGSTIYVAGTNGNRIDRYDTSTGAYLGALPTTTPIVGPEGIEISEDGNYLYVSSNTTPNSSTYLATNRVGIYKVFLGSPDATKPTELLSGGPQRPTPATGTEPIDQARFHHLEGLGMDASGNVYVAEADRDFRQIRKIDPQQQTVSIIATFPPGFAAHEIRVEPDGSVIVPGENSRKIYLISPNGNVSVIAGKTSLYNPNPNRIGAQGLSQGALSESTFLAPVGVDFDPDGNLYITDRYWGIRKINRLSPRSGTQLCHVP